MERLGGRWKCPTQVGGCVQDGTGVDNWHDLFCLNSTTGAVVSVDDDRRVLHAWPNAKSFLNSLSYAVEVDDSDDDDGFVGWQ